MVSLIYINKSDKIHAVKILRDINPSRSLKKDLQKVFHFKHGISNGFCSLSEAFDFPLLIIISCFPCFKI